MKTIITSCAIALFATSVAAGGLGKPIVETPAGFSGVDLSGYNDGLTKRVVCSNVPARSGSVGGFFIPNIGYFVQEAAASYSTIDAIVVPSEYDVKDGSEVSAYLQSVGLFNFELEIRSGSDYRVERREVEEELPTDNGPSWTVRTPKPEAPKEPTFIDVLVKENVPAYRLGWCN